LYPSGIRKKIGLLLLAYYYYYLAFNAPRVDHNQEDESQEVNLKSVIGILIGS